MAWYNNIFRGTQDEKIEVLEKLNPIQQYFGQSQSSREYTQNYEQYYETLEVVNRAVNMVVDDSAEIPSVLESIKIPGVIKGIKRSKVHRLINEEPNLFQDINSCLLYTSPSPRD